MRTFGRVIHNALDLLFPTRCVLCRDWCAAGPPMLCLGCAENVDRQRRQEACPTCAATVADYEVSKGRCGKCRGRRPPVRGTVRVGPYAEALERLLRSYKYHGRHELEPVLGGWLAGVVSKAPWLSRIEAIVSVPTHWKRRIGRPLYAADALASVVAEKTGLLHVPVLRRVRADPHQMGLSDTERIHNVRGAFALRRGVVLRDTRLLLIDDVKTTGATINECARVLRRGGAAEVYAAIVVAVGWDHPMGYTLSSI